MKLSYQQIRSLMDQAMPKAYVVDLYDDNVIYEEDGKYFQSPYAIMDGKLQMGQKTEVQKKVEYVAMKSAVRILSAVAASSGNKWRVQVVDYGTDKNRTHWTESVLRASLDKFEGAKVFQLSEAQHQAESHPFGKSPRERVGWFSNVAATATGIEADLNVLPSAKDIREDLMFLDSQGMLAADKPVVLGLSVDINGKSSIKQLGGVKVKYLETVENVTTDIVYDPAAGGKFLRMAAATQQVTKEATMVKRLLAALKQQRPDLKASIEALEAKGDAVTEEEVLNLQAAAMAAPQGAPGGDGIVEVMQKLLASIDSRAQAQVKELISTTTKKFDDAEKLLACSTQLITELQASGLVDVSRERVRSQFEGKIFESAALTAAIKSEKEYVDKLTGSGTIDGMGGQASVLGGRPENAAALLSDFFKGKNGQHSIRAAYVAITGDTRITGRIQDAHRLRASISTTSFDQIFGDAVHKQMIEDYNSLGMDDWKKIVKIVPLSDFKTVHRVRKGGYGNLPVVAEGGDYLALATPTDEEQSYAPTKKGGTEDLTIEAIKNDDAGGVRDIPMDLARAAKTTLYEFVFNNLFASNPTMGYDSTALFHADHGNLGSAALDATALTARRQAMAKQTRLYNGKRLNIRAKYGLVPVDLDKTMFDLIAKPGDFTPAAADFTRTFGLEPIVVVCWTDTTDWGLAADPRFCPTIEIGFVDGNEEPQLYVQDMPNAGSMFNADKLIYKIRHPYGGVNLDHRGVDLSVVAGG